MSPDLVLSVTIVLALASLAGQPLGLLIQGTKLRAIAVGAGSRTDPRNPQGPGDLFGPMLAKRITRVAELPTSHREARRSGRRDPLQRHRATVGLDAYTPWYIKIRALLILLVFVALAAAAIVAVVVAILASGRFVLETLAS